MYPFFYQLLSACLFAFAKNISRNMTVIPPLALTHDFSLTNTLFNNGFVRKNPGYSGNSQRPQIFCSQNVAVKNA